ncbi:MAG: hypothetical protein PVF20_06850, partial [Desulfobacterales bacterium]
MRQRTLWWTVILTVLTGLLAAAPAANLDDGFLDIPWKADLRHLDGFTLLYGNGDLRFYSRPDTLREIDGIEIPRVVYGTFRYQFFAAYLDIDTIEAFKGIQSYMESTYGFPKTQWSVAGEKTIHKWTYHQIRMKLKHSESDNRMKLAFYYAPI